MHGHNYQLLAKVYGKSDEWLDFEDIKRKVDQFIDEKYDHHDIGNMSCEDWLGSYKNSSVSSSRPL
jgi:6-pyruvoyl-tetrahydropterin synthase